MMTYRSVAVPTIAFYETYIFEYRLDKFDEICYSGVFVDEAFVDLSFVYSVSGQTLQSSITWVQAVRTLLYTP